MPSPHDRNSFNVTTSSKSNDYDDYEDDDDDEEDELGYSAQN